MADNIITKSGGFLPTEPVIDACKKLIARAKEVRDLKTNFLNHEAIKEFREKKRLFGSPVIISDEEAIARAKRDREYNMNYFAISSEYADSESFALDLLHLASILRGEALANLEKDGSIFITVEDFNCIKNYYRE